jgi:cobalt/nickel transport system permease protein
MHHKIDSLAYLNHLRYLPPGEKLVFTLMLLILIYLSSVKVQLVIIGWLILWVVVYAKIPLGFYLKLLLIPVSFWLLSIPAIAIAIGGITPDIWTGINIGKVYVYLSRQGMIQGGELLIRAIALTSSLYFLLLTTPLSEILGLLERLGCPRLIIELLTLMYRFIDILSDTASQFLLAQNCRLGYVNYKRGITSLGLLVSQLLRRSLENYRQIVLGLDARNFNGKIKFWQPILYKSNPRYTIEAIAGYCFLLYYAYRV